MLLGIGLLLLWQGTAGALVAHPLPPLTLASSSRLGSPPVLCAEDDSSRAWLAAVSPPEIEALDERPALFRAASIRREILLGARTMLAYHQVLMLASFVARFAFSVLCHITPQAALARVIAAYNAHIGAIMSPIHAIEYAGKTWAFLLMGIVSGRLTTEALQPLLEAHPLTLAHALHNSDLARDSLNHMITAPFLEEVAYRGIAQGAAFYALTSIGMTRHGSAALISRIIGAAFFGLAHCVSVNGGRDLAICLQKGIGTFTSSLLIESRLAHRRRSVWAAAGAHMAYNLASSVFVPTTIVMTNLGLAVLAAPRPHQLLLITIKFCGCFYVHRVLLRALRAFLGDDDDASYDRW